MGNGALRKVPRLGANESSSTHGVAARTRFGADIVPAEMGRLLLVTATTGNVEL
jgi:hypothetical protein